MSSNTSLARLGKLERRLAPPEKPCKVDTAIGRELPDGRIEVEGYESYETFRAARPDAMLLLLVVVQDGRRPAEEADL